MTLKIVAFSDTHSHHRKISIPDGDILICAGDITYQGELPIIEDFCKWMASFSHKYKILIFGNHEVGIENGYKRSIALKMVADNDITYLEDSGIEIEGLKFWGSPITKFFYNWEWNRHPGPNIKKHWDKIPDDTNILITHGPPYGILDVNASGEHCGCYDLLERVWELKQLRLMAFGHIHKNKDEIPVEIEGVKFVNASILDERYKIHNDPVIIDL